QDRRLAAAVDLVEDAHAVALDVALVIRIQRPGLLARTCLLVGDGDGHVPLARRSVEVLSSVFGRATNQFVSYTALRCQPPNRTCTTRPWRMATSGSRRVNRRARCCSPPPLTCCARRATPPPRRAPSPSARVRDSRLSTTTSAPSAACFLPSS